MTWRAQRLPKRPDLQLSPGVLTSCRASRVGVTRSSGLSVRGFLVNSNRTVVCEGPGRFRSQYEGGKVLSLRSLKHPPASRLVQEACPPGPQDQDGPGLAAGLPRKEHIREMRSPHLDAANPASGLPITVLDHTGQRLASASDVVASTPWSVVPSSLRDRRADRLH